MSIVSLLFLFGISLILNHFHLALYFKKIGRRKTWIIPFMTLAGIILLVSSFYVNEWLGDGKENAPYVITLTIVFFSLRMCTATQDIAGICKLLHNKFIKSLKK